VLVAEERWAGERPAWRAVVAAVGLEAGVLVSPLNQGLAVGSLLSGAVGSAWESQLF